MGHIKKYDCSTYNNYNNRFLIMTKNIEEKKLTVEIILASVLALAGLTLLFLGFYAVPIGEISASVLTAFGETGTFSGALMGIDYSYRYKRFKLENDNNIREREND